MLAMNRLWRVEYGFFLKNMIMGIENWFDYKDMFLA